MTVSRDRLGRWGRTVSARRRERRRRRTPEQDGVHSSPVGLRVVHVDAFTDTPFLGNPAAVCVLPAPRDERWMQDVAREMNLAETAFLHPENKGYRLRWFTPTVEVALCGHATLASAHVLWEDSDLPRDRQARFHTKSGLLTADRRGAWIELDFPAKSEAPTPAPAGLAEALGTAPKYVGRNQFDYLVELDSEETVRGLTPDYAARFFAPGSGIAEDPVTGSSHCALGPFWSARLGKSELLAYQASARGGVVRVRVVGDRVKLGGQAVTVLRADLL